MSNIKDVTDFDLVLLVGTNPLPNYVVAKYFADNPECSLKRIWFIYSSKTEKYKDNLKEFFNNNKYKNLKYSCVHLEDVGNPTKIISNIESKLNKKSELLGSHIHLNYTGGTKAMVIYSYKTIEEFCSKNNKKVSFSYLDARTFQLINDEDGNSINNSNDLREKIDINYEDLLKLHGRTKEPDNENYDDLNNLLLNDFKNLVKENSKYEQYLKDKKNKNGLFAQIIEKIPNYNEKDNKIAKYLNVWLEFYVIDTLKEVYGNNVLKGEKIKKGDEKNFEIDVVLINGYQLIGISCTTSRDKEKYKNKGFEILLRTRQMGGDESRAILITTLDDNTRKKVEEELQTDTGGGKSIIVLGIEDLKPEELIKKVKKFVKEGK